MNDDSADGGKTSVVTKLDAQTLFAFGVSFGTIIIWAELYFIFCPSHNLVPHLKLVRDSILI